jgi:hypothetical protein
MPGENMDSFDLRQIPMRDYFAGQALIGLASRTDLPAHLIAQLAYQIADALLDERHRPVTSSPYPITGFTTLGNDKTLKG